MPAKEGYCVKCKSKKEIKDAQDITMKNGAALGHVVINCAAG